MEVAFKPSFVRQYKRLDPQLQTEVREKIELFKDKTNHKQLKVHTLTGKLKGTLSFSVNYKIRIVFIYEHEDLAVLLAVGGHEIYNV